eukprot:gene6419-10427_t
MSSEESSTPVKNILETRSNKIFDADDDKHKIPYYDPYKFEFSKRLEENTEVILKELSGLTETDFMKWPEDICETGWDVYGIYAFGRKLEENAKRCPETLKLIDSIPNVTTAGFSSLKPGAHITPHKGYEGYSQHVLRLHLGLITPKDCYLKVGEEKKSWEKGKVLIFDDFMTHEAWNSSDQTRIILLLDFQFDKYGVNPDTEKSNFTTGLKDLLKNIDMGNLEF